MLQKFTGRFSAALLLFFALAVFHLGSFPWNSDLPKAAAVLFIGAVTGFIWLFYRGSSLRPGLPKTGLEIPLLAFYFAVLLSLIFSQSARSGLERAGWFLLYGFLFYFLITLLEQPTLRKVFPGVLLVFTGLVSFIALSETYGYYLSWWDSVGSRSIMPPFPYRFLSIMGHPNIFTIMMNMCAPLAIVLLLTTRSRAGRIGSLFWLFTYICTLPFSSSRTGWLGIPFWAGTLFLLWLISSGKGQSILRWIRQHALISAAAGLAGAAAGGFVLLKFYLAFAASHPSHGAAFSLNREHIWRAVLDAWQTSPWFGIGTGRVGLETMIYSGFPPRFWPSYAHSLPLQILAEVGLVGFLPFLALTIAVFIKMIQAYRNAPETERWWNAASLAALVGIVVPGIFDDMTQVPFMVVLALYFVASLLTSRGPLPRFQRIPRAALTAPFAMVIGIAVFALWGYAPLYSALQQGSTPDWRELAAAAETSIQRDPAHVYYYTQASLAWAKEWQQTGSLQALDKARAHMAKSLEIEPVNPVHWADLAVLEWHSGMHEQAVQHIRHAIDLSTDEPAFYLNYGWFLEQRGEEAEALAQYQEALRLDPAPANHPFWQLTQVRRDAVEPYVEDAALKEAHWKMAQDYLTAGNIPAARLEIATAGTYSEPAYAISSAEVALALAEGDEQDIHLQIEKFKETIRKPNWDARGAYPFYFRREGIQSRDMPGFIHLSEDAGQFETLEMIYQREFSSGDCQSANEMWAILQNELHGGEIIPGGYTPAPACP